MTKDDIIKKGNRQIAEFMGYTFYHPNVDIDTSDCGGIYERFEIFSKTPIIVKEFPESDQYYFGDVPHPEDENKTVSWGFQNWDYKTALDYHNNWNELMPVVQKCCEEISKRPGVDSRGGWTPQFGYTELLYTMRLNSPIHKVWNEVIVSINKINSLKQK